MKKRKLRKPVWIVLFVLILICAFAGSKLLFGNDKGNAASGGDASIIENKGDLEIIIPEDMESDGF